MTQEKEGMTEEVVWKINRSGIQSTHTGFVLYDGRHNSVRTDRLM